MKTTKIISRPKIFIYWMAISSILFLICCISLIVNNDPSFTKFMHDLSFALGFSIFIALFTVPLWKSQLTIYNDDTIHIKSWLKDHQFSVSDIDSLSIERLPGSPLFTFIRLSFKGDVRFQIWKPIGWTNFNKLKDYLNETRAEND